MTAFRKSAESKNANVHTNHPGADLTKLRTELVAQMADYNCLSEADLPRRVEARYWHLA